MKRFANNRVKLQTKVYISVYSTCTLQLNDNIISLRETKWKTDDSKMTFLSYILVSRILYIVIKVIMRGPFVQTLCIEKDSYMDAI